MAKKDFSYNNAIQEIEDILAQLENEGLDIDDLSNKVKRVSGLIKQCKSKLRQTEEEVQKIMDEMDAE